jgi:3-oxoadipate enol-lactonase/4-carboxymuconolactone decarboxylase
MSTQRGDADTRSSLSQIKMRTLVIAGEEDRVTPPRESAILAKGISNSTLSIIPGARSFLDDREPGDIQPHSEKAP